MLFGYVNTDYIIFVIKNDPESLQEKIEEVEFAIRAEYQMKQMNIYSEEDFWDF